MDTAEQPAEAFAVSSFDLLDEIVQNQTVPTGHIVGIRVYCGG